MSHEIGLHPHPVYNWLGGSPDGITESGKLLEIKCPMMREIKDEVPVHYMPQLQLLMEILDLESCDFIQYKPEEITWPKPVEFVVTHVKRDREWFAEKLPIMEVCETHKRRVEEIPPPVPRRLSGSVYCTTASTASRDS